MGGHRGDVSSRVGGRGRRGALRCHGVAVRARCRVRAVPDLRQRTLALRTAPRSHRSRLPCHVCGPHPGPEDAAVISTLGREPVSTQSPHAEGKMSRKLGRWPPLAVVALIGAGCSNERAEDGNAANTNADYENAVKFAECMRENGVSESPDPDAPFRSPRVSSPLGCRLPAVTAGRSANAGSALPVLPVMRSTRATRSCRRCSAPTPTTAPARGRVPPARPARAASGRPMDQHRERGSADNLRMRPASHSRSQSYDGSARNVSHARRSSTPSTWGQRRRRPRCMEATLSGLGDLAAHGDAADVSAAALGRSAG